MSSRTLSQCLPIATAKSIADVRAACENQFEAVQLARLAGDVLSRSPPDLMALAADNPALIWEWIEEFRRRKAKADAEARLWSAAITRLSGTIPDSMPSAAE